MKRSKLMKTLSIQILIIVNTLNLYGQNKFPIIITGTVFSEEKTPLPYTNITIKGTDLGTISAIDGSFSIELPKMDKPNIIFHFIGYESKTITIDPLVAGGKPLTIILKVGSLSFSPIEIIGKTSLEKESNIEPSLRVLDIHQLTSIPSIGGGDVFRALQTIPSVNSSSELSNQLYVRGGTPDQNLTLINGVPVYQPFHLFGLSSSVDDASVEYVRYYSGGFSVRYGDRMSSVLDIVTKPGSDSLSIYLDMNLIHSGATASGSLGDKMRWRVTGRRTYFDIMGKAGGLDFPYYFYDVEGKLSYLPGPKSLITLNTFISNDDYDTGYERLMYNSLYQYYPDLSIARADSNQYRKINKSKVNWTNRLLSLRWMKRHSLHHLSEVTLYSSSLGQDVFNQKSFVPHPGASKSTLDEVKKENENWNYKSGASDANTRLSDTGINLSHEWNISETVETAFGGGYSVRTLDYYWNTAKFDVISPYINMFMDFPPDSMDYDLELRTLYGYAEVIIHPVRSLWIRGGIRATGYSGYTDTALDPRINLTWEFHPYWKFKLGWGKFSQSLSSSIEYGFYSVASLNFPNDTDFPESVHTLAGLIYDNQQNLLIDFAFYNKAFSHLLYFDKEGEFKSGYGESYGTELMISFLLNKSFSTQLSYGYSITQKTQDAETFYPNYDQRHKLNWQMAYKLGRGWNLNALWTMSTGRPANLATSTAYSGIGYQSWDDESEPYFDLLPIVLDLPKNVFRYPVFHRFDISITKKWLVRKGIISTYIQILNVYNRQNVVFYEDIKEESEDIPDPDRPGYIINKRKFVAENFNGFPFLPTIGVTYEF